MLIFLLEYHFTGGDTGWGYEVGPW